MSAGSAQSGPRLAAPYRHYSLKLTPLLNDSYLATGLALKARIAGGGTLNLLLDSGAEDLILPRRTAGRLGLRPESSVDVVGFGASIRPTTRLAPARLETGGLALDDCPVLATDQPMREGVDGVVPMAFFASFLLRLDIPAKLLDLDPYPTGKSGDAADFVAARADRNTLFLPSQMDGRLAYLMLDTGAGVSGVSPRTASAWRNYAARSRNISLAGGAGRVAGLLLPEGVTFRVGGQMLAADPAAVVDLSGISIAHRFEISGVIGFPALRRSVVTVNYRDALVRLAKSGR